MCFDGNGDLFTTTFEADNSRRPAAFSASGPSWPVGARVGLSQPSSAPPS